MTKADWKEFWEEVATLAHEVNCILHKKEADGGWRVLILREDDEGVPSPEQMSTTAPLVTQARYGLRTDEAESYIPMLRVTQMSGPNAFGGIKEKITYISQDPHAVFAMLYA